MKKNKAFPLVIGASMVLLAHSAHAGLITVGETYSPVVQVDASSASRSLVSSTSGTITDVNVFVDFTKCDDPIGSNGACNGGELSFNRELALWLTGPDGTVVDLVYNSFNVSPTYTGNTGARVSVMFDDEAAVDVGGNVLLNGTFRPEELLSAFDGKNALGTWTLSIQDSVGADPATLNGWRLEITTATVPEPASVALICAGLMGLGASRRKRSA